MGFRETSIKPSHLPRRRQPGHRIHAGNRVHGERHAAKCAHGLNLPVGRVQYKVATRPCQESGQGAQRAPRPTPKTHTYPWRPMSRNTVLDSGWPAECADSSNCCRPSFFEALMAASPTICDTSCAKGTFHIVGLTSSQTIAVASPKVTARTHPMQIAERNGLVRRWRACESRPSPWATAGRPAGLIAGKHDVGRDQSEEESANGEKPERRPKACPQGLVLVGGEEGRAERRRKSCQHDAIEVGTRSESLLHRQCSLLCPESEAHIGETPPSHRGAVCRQGAGSRWKGSRFLLESSFEIC